MIPQLQLLQNVSLVSDTQDFRNKKHFFFKLVWGPDVIHETALNIPIFRPVPLLTSWLSPEISCRWQEHLWLPCSETSTLVCCRIIWTSSWLLLLSVSRRKSF